jgi:alpha-tubulin suppressor-like RCC1 family protein
MGAMHPQGSRSTCSNAFPSAGRLATVVFAAALALALGASAAFAQKPIEKPVNTSPPTISGKAQEGATLKAKEGKWTGGSLVYSFQWQRCEPEVPCTNIPSATTSEYTARYVDVGSTLRVIVTASNSAGSTEAASEQTAPIAPVAPKNTTLPVISGAAERGPEEGQLLTVSTGEWSGTPATRYLYQWERCTPSKKCSEISGAEEAGYRVAAADVGDTLRAVVTDENLAGSKSATSAVTKTATYGPPIPVGFPTITGRLREGGTLEAGPGTWVGQSPITYSYAWESCNAEGGCMHATGATYTLAAGDVGNTVRVTATAKNELGSASASSVATPQVLNGSADFAVGWGEDLRGQLGTLYHTPWEESPVLAEGESDITQIATGGSFSLELHADGAVTAAGAGYYGSIGDGGRKASWEQGKSHVSVSGLSEVKAISAGGEYGLALLNDGDLEAWGNNGYGTLGNGTGGFEKETGENQLTPKEVRALNGAGVTAIASGGGANFAVLGGGTGDGKVMAWGHNNGGQLGVAWPEDCKKRKTCEESAKKPSEEEGKKEAAHKCFTEVGWELCGKVPEPVVEAGGADLEHVIAVSAGFESAYALLEDGEVVSWGNDGKGQLGQKLEPGAHTTFTPPARVMVNETEPLKHVVAIAAGNSQALALLEGGRVVGWGDNGGGALGELAPTSCGKENKNGGGTWECDRYATPISALDGIDVTAIAAGGGFSAVLGSEGKVYTVGTNQYGELGVGPKCENEGGEMGYQNTCYSRVWTAVPGLEDVQAISAQLKDINALLGSAATPPFPVVENVAGALTMKLESAFPNGEASDRIALRVWEHPGENEFAESEGNEGSEEGSEGEEGGEEGTGEPPTNTTLPMLRVFEVVEGEPKKVKGEAAVRQFLEATPGNWTGTQPLNYEYRWLRCKDSKCSAVTPWLAGASETKGSEPKSEPFQLTEEDAGYAFEAEVAAHHEGEAHGLATSTPSEIIKAEGEGRNSKAEYINLDGANGTLIRQLKGEPLEAVQYEIKLSSQGGPKAKTRTMVVAPHP